MSERLGFRTFSSYAYLVTDQDLPHRDYRKQCDECGEPYVALRSDRRFCSAVCRAAWHRRANEPELVVERDKRRKDRREALEIALRISTAVADDYPPDPADVVRFRDLLGVLPPSALRI